MSHTASTTILLSGRRYLIDAEDYARVTSKNWKVKGTDYQPTTSAGRHTLVTLSRFILDANERVYFRSDDHTDFRRSNLMIGNAYEEVSPGVSRIYLGDGRIGLIDSDRVEWARQWKWSAMELKTGLWYVGRFDRAGNKLVLLHREILGLPRDVKRVRGDRIVTNHINHNTLDNRAENLETLRDSENILLTGKPIKNQHGYYGVFRHKRGLTYRALASIHGTTYTVAGIPTASEAAAAFNFLQEKFRMGRGKINVLPEGVKFNPSDYEIAVK